MKLLPSPITRPPLYRLCADPNIVRTHRILSCAPGIKEAAGPDDIEAIVKIRYACIITHF